MLQLIKEGHKTQEENINTKIQMLLVLSVKGVLPFLVEKNYLQRAPLLTKKKLKTKKKVP